MTVRVRVWLMALVHERFQRLAAEDLDFSRCGRSHDGIVHRVSRPGLGAPRSRSSQALLEGWNRPMVIDGSWKTAITAPRPVDPLEAERNVNEHAGGARTKWAYRPCYANSRHLLGTHHFRLRDVVARQITLLFKSVHNTSIHPGTDDSSLKSATKPGARRRAAIFQQVLDQCSQLLLGHRHASARQRIGAAARRGPVWLGVVEIEVCRYWLAEGRRQNVFHRLAVLVELFLVSSFQCRSRPRSWIGDRLNPENVFYPYPGIHSPADFSRSGLPANFTRIRAPL